MIAKYQSGIGYFSLSFSHFNVRKTSFLILSYVCIDALSENKAAQTFRSSLLPVKSAVLLDFTFSITATGTSKVRKRRIS